MGITVEELIEMLKEADPESEVVVAIDIEEPTDDWIAVEEVEMRDGLRLRKYAVIRLAD